MGDKLATLYKGDYGPAQLFKGDAKIAGYAAKAKQGTELVSADTYNDRLELAIEGRSEQAVTVQGVNLLDLTGIDLANSGVTCTLQSDGTVRLDGTTTVPFWCSSVLYIEDRLTSGVAYSFSFVCPNAKIRLIVRTILTDGRYLYNNTVTFDNAVSKVQVYLQINEAGIATNTSVKIQMEKGFVATSWQPYIPNSPSPDYPSPIRSSENFDMVSCGRNLMGQERWYNYLYSIDQSNVAIKSDLSHANYISMYCQAYGSVSRFMRGEFLDRTQYTFSYWYKLETTLQEGLPYHTGIRIQYTDGTNSYGLVDYGHKTTQWIYVTLISAVDKTIDYLYFLNSGGYSPWSGFADFQIEEGTVTPYQPYKSTTSHITEPLRSVGNVADTIEVAGGKVEVVRRVLRVPVTSSSDMFEHTEIYQNGYTHFRVRTREDLNYKCWCNVLPFKQWSWVLADVCICCSVNFIYPTFSNVVLGISDTDTPTQKVSKLKSWLTTHEMYVDVLPNTPTRTDITATPLGQQLLAMRTQPHYTQVYTNAEIQPILRAAIKTVER